MLLNRDADKKERKTEIMLQEVHKRALVMIGRSFLSRSGSSAVRSALQM